MVCGSLERVRPTTKRLRFPLNAWKLDPSRPSLERLDDLRVGAARVVGFGDGFVALRADGPPRGFAFELLPMMLKLEGDRDAVNRKRPGDPVRLRGSNSGEGLTKRQRRVGFARLPAIRLTPGISIDGPACGIDGPSARRFPLLRPRGESSS